MDWLTEIIDWSEVWATLIPLIIFFIRRPNAPWIKSMVTYLCVLLAISLVVDINFCFFENINEDFSSRLFSIEAGIILLYCLLFIYHVNLSDEIVSITSLSEFWAVTGFTLYAAINFFIFMFFQYLIKAAKEAFAIDICNVHNIRYIVLNLFIAFAIFKAEKTNNATSVN